MKSKHAAFFVRALSVPAYAQDSEAHKQSLSRGTGKSVWVEGERDGKQAGDTLIEVSQWLFRNSE